MASSRVLLFRHRDWSFFSHARPQHSSIGVRRCELALIVPVDGRAPLVHVAVHVLALAENLAHDEMLLDVLRLQLTENRSVLVRIASLNLHDLCQGIGVRGPARDLLEVFSNVANLFEVLAPFVSLRLLAQVLRLHDTFVPDFPRRMLKLHLSLVLPLFEVLDLQHLRGLFVISHHLVCLVKLAVRADRLAVLLVLHQIL